MSKLTKIELAQANAALGAEVQALRVKVAEQAATIEVLKAAKPNAQAERKVFVRREYQPSAEQLALREAMAAAKALAMASGRSVRVGA